MNDVKHGIIDNDELQKHEVWYYGKKIGELNYNSSDEDKKMFLRIVLIK